MNGSDFDGRQSPIPDAYVIRHSRKRNRECTDIQVGPDKHRVLIIEDGALAVSVASQHLQAINVERLFERDVVEGVRKMIPLTGDRNPWKHQLGRGS